MRAETNATWAHTPRLQGGVPLASAPPPAHPQPVEGKSRALILLTHTCNNEAALSNPCSALATTRTKGSELGRWRGDGGQGCDWRLAARAPRRCTRPLASATPAGHAEPHARHVPPDGALPRPLGLQMPCSSCRGDPRNLASPPHPRNDCFNTSLALARSRVHLALLFLVFSSPPRTLLCVPPSPLPSA